MQGTEKGTSSWGDDLFPPNVATKDLWGTVRIWEEFVTLWEEVEIRVFEYGEIVTRAASSVYFENPYMRTILLWSQVLKNYATTRLVRRPIGLKALPVNRKAWKKRNSKPQIDDGIIIE